MAGAPDTWLEHQTPGWSTTRGWSTRHLAGTPDTWLDHQTPGWTTRHLAGAPDTWLDHQTNFYTGIATCKPDYASIQNKKQLEHQNIKTSLFHSYAFPTSVYFTTLVHRQHSKTGLAHTHPVYRAILSKKHFVQNTSINHIKLNVSCQENRVKRQIAISELRRARTDCSVKTSLTVNKTN